MENKNRCSLLQLFFTAVFLLCLVSSANAALVDRGGGLIYDTDLNITWLQNANHGAGSSYDSGPSTTDGIMTWNDAVAWAANLSYYDSVRNVTYTDWRLPTTPQQDLTCSIQWSGISYGNNCTGSEMGHLFYNELGGVAGYDIASTHNSNYSLFSNVQSYVYWSGMVYALNNLVAWDFTFGNGYQNANFKGDGGYAWAVRGGDVAAVPIPAAFWLFGSGLIGFIGAARCKKTKND